MQAAATEDDAQGGPVVLSFDVGTRNFALCMVQAAPLRILRWEVFDIIAENKLPSKTNIEEKKCALLSSLCRRRDSLCQPLGADDSVVIEQQPFQPGRGSPTMTILAHAIGTFFVLAGVDWACTERGQPPARPAFVVRQVSARTKLAVEPEAWGGRPISPAPAKKRRRATTAAAAAPRTTRQKEYDRYKLNKGRGVEICRSILRGQPALEPWREQFEQSRKRDDLADAFLQALSQIRPPE